MVYQFQNLLSVTFDLWSFIKYLFNHSNKLFHLPFNHQWRSIIKVILVILNTQLCHKFRMGDEIRTRDLLIVRILLEPPDQDHNTWQKCIYIDWCLFVYLIVFKFDHRTSCSLFNVRRHVIGFINHDIAVVGLWFMLLMRLSYYIHLGYGKKLLWGYPTTSI